ncbi:hypothetical protein KCP76_25595 [Salmonella enterica subsp. enterica serovar Weltevreden]|nr:hypothetical protein KCP76_25595 [Salmonella enterica subsp. enterica serovar Weltevreden]
MLNEALAGGDFASRQTAASSITITGDSPPIIAYVVGPRRKKTLRRTSRSLSAPDPQASPISTSRYRP